MKKTIFYLLILALMSSTIYGQITNSQQLLNHSNNVTNIDLRSKNMEGSPFIDDEFMPAKLSVDGTIYGMRYNAYDDEIEVKQSNKTYSLKKNFNYSIIFLENNKTYEVYDFNIGNNLKQGFFVILYKGDKVSLLKKETIKFYEEVKPKSGYEKYQPPKLKRAEDQLFISYNNKIAIELSNKKKDILNIFSNKSKEVESYAKQHKLNFKKEKDLVQIFKYYNSIP